MAMTIFANAATESFGSSILVAELIIIAAVAIAVKWIRLPYTIALVAAGLGVGMLRAQHFIDLEVSLTPELVFTIFLPVLLFEAAFNPSSTVGGPFWAQRRIDVRIKLGFSPREVGKNDENT